MRTAEKLDFGCIFPDRSLSFRLCVSHSLTFYNIHRANEIQLHRPTDHPTKQQTNQHRRWFNSVHFHLWVNVDIYYANCKIEDSFKWRKVFSYHKSENVQSTFGCYSCHEQRIDKCVCVYITISKWWSLTQQRTTQSDPACISQQRNVGRYMCGWMGVSAKCISVWCNQ